MIIYQSTKFVVEYISCLTQIYNVYHELKLRTFSYSSRNMVDLKAKLPICSYSLITNFFDSVLRVKILILYNEQKYIFQNSLRVKLYGISNSQ